MKPSVFLNDNSDIITLSWIYSYLFAVSLGQFQFPCSLSHLQYCTHLPVQKTPLQPVKSSIFHAVDFGKCTPVKRRRIMSPQTRRSIRSGRMGYCFATHTWLSYFRLWPCMYCTPILSRTVPCVLALEIIYFILGYIT